MTATAMASSTAQNGLGSHKVSVGEDPVLTSHFSDRKLNREAPSALGSRQVIGRRVNGVTPVARPLEKSASGAGNKKTGAILRLADVRFRTTIANG